MEWSFNLEWDELDEELRERKIKEFMEYSELDYDDDQQREKAEYIISIHFPLYF